MSYLNKVILLGNITKQPEEKYLPSGVSTCTFNLATNENYKNKENEWQQKTEFHRVVCWNKVSEYISKQARVGDRLLIEGKLQTRSWEQDGEKKYITEINASSVKIVFNKKEKEKEKDTEEVQPIYTEDDIPF